MTAALTTWGRVADLEAGVWKYERKGDRVAMTIEPFAKLAKWAVMAAEVEAGALGRFLGAEPEVTWPA